MTTTNYTGSQKTAELVKSQIAERFGAPESYDPRENCRTYRDWQRQGYQVKHGEKAIKSYIIIRFKDNKGREESRRKTINLFYHTQVEKI